SEQYNTVYTWLHSLSSLYLYIKNMSHSMMILKWLREPHLMNTWWNLDSGWETTITLITLHSLFCPIHSSADKNLKSLKTSQPAAFSASIWQSICWKFNQNCQKLNRNQSSSSSTLLLLNLQNIWNGKIRSTVIEN